jgi:hypothetical protein
MTSMRVGTLRSCATLVLVTIVAACGAPAVTTASPPGAPPSGAPISAQAAGSPPSTRKVIEPSSPFAGNVVEVAAIDSAIVPAAQIEFAIVDDELSISEEPPRIERKQVRVDPKAPTARQVTVAVAQSIGLPLLGQAQQVEFPGGDPAMAVDRVGPYAASGMYSPERSLLAVYVTVADNTVLTATVVGFSRKEAIAMVLATKFDTAFFAKCMTGGMLNKELVACRPGTRRNGTLDPSTP